MGHGHVRRPVGSTLESYRLCFPREHDENRHVKTIANMEFVDRVGPDPHHFLYQV